MIVSLAILIYNKPVIETPDTSLYKVDSDQVYKHMDYIHRLLEGYDIKHWLILSTLLGAVRDKNIIKEDNYFYFGANYADTETIVNLTNFVSKDGYTLTKPVGKVWDYLTLTKQYEMWICSIQVKYQDVPVGEIFMYYQFPDGIMRRLDIANNMYYYPIFSFPAWYIQELTEVTIRNKPYPAPRKAHILLKHWYGDNWNKPNLKQLTVSDKYNGKIDTSKIVLYNLAYFLDKSYSITVHPYLNTTVTYIAPKEQKMWITANDTPNQKKA